MNYLLINRRNFQLLVLFMICMLAVMGCEQPGSDSAGGGNDGGRQFITLGTAGKGGAFVPVGNAIANIVETKKGDLNWVVASKGTKGTQENIRNLESGELQFAMANAAISYFAVKGEGDWGKPHQVRAVATIAPNVGVFVTTKGSGIESIADLKDKRVVLGPAGAGFDYFLKPLLKAHGIAYQDMTVRHGSFLTAGDMIADGKADAAFMGGAIPIAAVTQLCSTQDVVFIKFDDDVTEKLREYPFYFSVPVPADKYSDLEEDLIGINVGNMQLISHENVAEDVVYEFTKRMYENREDIAQQHPAGKALNPKNIIRDTGTPFHPGAIKYYQEIGIWPEK